MSVIAKIAIIEDDMAISQMYRMKFEADGFEVETAGDGESGLALIKSFQPDVILLDLMMPNMDGKEMLKQLRQAGPAKQPRVLVLSNINDAETTKAIHEMKADDFIIKSELTPRQVSERVKQLLGLSVTP